MGLYTTEEESVEDIRKTTIDTHIHHIQEINIIDTVMNIEIGIVTITKITTAHNITLTIVLTITLTIVLNITLTIVHSTIITAQNIILIIVLLILNLAIITKPILMMLLIIMREDIQLVVVEVAIQLVEEAVAIQLAVGVVQAVAGEEVDAEAEVVEIDLLQISK